MKLAGSPVTVLGYKLINNKKYYQIGKNQYVLATNIDAIVRTAKKNTYLRTRLGRIQKDNLVRKGSRVMTYGSKITINNQKYYALNATQYVLASDIR